ncbi:MAG: hypothetical protein AB7L66_14980 [Gemmatimonadales bacterium]
MRLAGLVAVAAGLAGVPALAQVPGRAAGQILRPGAGGQSPVGGIRVVLHRVGLLQQGPVDTVETDAQGRFRFRFALDTAASYLVSANYAGIEYFSQPLSRDPARPDTAVQVVVFDTSSTAPVALRNRTIVIGSPDPLGTRTVIDWLAIENRGRVTRVEEDSLDPTWSAPLPPEARNPVLGDAAISRISPDALIFRNDSVGLIAPVSPGAKEILLQYEITADSRQLTLETAGADSAEVFLEERTARVPTTGWVTRDSQLFEGRSFLRVERGAGADGRLVVRFPRTTPARWMLPLLVAGTALLLAALAWWRLRRPIKPRPS